MALFLVQHGKSLPKDLDPAQGLSEGGIKTVTRMAQIAAQHGTQVGCIWHSGKKRALQTAEIMADMFKPQAGIREQDGLKPLDDVVSFAHLIKTAGNLMLVGHLPFMERLAAYLITGTTDQPVVKFQNGGIVALDHTDDGESWIIKWMLSPELTS